MDDPFTSTQASLNSLMFPAASGNFSHVLKSLKQSKYSIRNRLESICKDSLFVKSVKEHYDLPLVANERCGSWYIHPYDKIGSVYFKSTDGHHGQWRFNTRRLNLILLDIIEAHHGCVVVDSTRRGKIMPDALSKTLPIWVAVMNRFLFPEVAEHHGLRTPSEAVSSSEHVQIESRLQNFLDDLKELGLDREALRRKLKRPMVAVFVTPGAAFPRFTISRTMDCYPIVCCTASAMESSDKDTGYIQGAADDTEHWANGLTAEVFWRSEGYLRADCTESELQSRIQQVMSEASSRSKEPIEPVYPSVNDLHHFYVGPLNALKSRDMRNYDCVVLCKEIKADLDSEVQGTEKPVENPEVLILNCSVGKNGSRALREQLPRLLPFMEDRVKQNPQPRMLFACATGKDLSIGIALATFCLYYDEDGAFTGRVRFTGIDKTYIRQRLIKIQSFLPTANPSRATLQAVNSFLMRRPT